MTSGSSRKSCNSLKSNKMEKYTWILESNESLPLVLASGPATAEQMQCFWVSYGTGCGVGGSQCYYSQVDCGKQRAAVHVNRFLYIEIEFATCQCLAATIGLFETERE